MMSKLMEILLTVIKIADEIKTQNKNIERLQNRVDRIDKRLVRIETIIEMAMGRSNKQINRN